MADKIDRDKLEAQMREMVNMISHPAFVESMRRMKETSSESERRDIGRKTLTPEALRKQGVPIPENMRITTRFFEPGRPEILDISPEGEVLKVEPSDISSNFEGIGSLAEEVGPEAWGACACGGAATVCAGAGGGT